MITSTEQAERVFTTGRLSPERCYLRNGIPAVLEPQPLSKLQVRRSAAIKRRCSVINLIAPQIILTTGVFGAAAMQLRASAPWNDSAVKG